MCFDMALGVFRMGRVHGERSEKTGAATYTINKKPSFSALMHQYTLRTVEVADLQDLPLDAPLYHALYSLSPSVHVVFGSPGCLVYDISCFGVLVLPPPGVLA
jgi:hypothetical protein